MKKDIELDKLMGYLGLNVDEGWEIKYVKTEIVNRVLEGDKQSLFKLMNLARHSTQKEIKEYARKILDGLDYEGYEIDETKEPVIDNRETEKVETKDIEEKGINKVLEEIATKIENTEGKDIADVKVELPAMEISDDITVPKGLAITGANINKTASTGERASNSIEGETVINGNVTLSDGAELNGVTVTTIPTFSADTETATIKNVKFIGNEILNPVTSANASANASANKDNKEKKATKKVGATKLGATKLGATKRYLIRPEGWDKKLKLDIEGCYFGSNDRTMYNLMELNTQLMDGSVIKDCYFAKDCCTHNAINIYAVDDNATITIENNHFEKSANASRIGIKGNKTATINYINNTYDETDTSEDNIWAGLVIIQPYAKDTESFKNITINIDRTKNKSAIKQVVYGFSNATDSKWEDIGTPVIYVDKEKIEYLPVIKYTDGKAGIYKDGIELMEGYVVE